MKGWSLALLALLALLTAVSLYETRQVELLLVQQRTQEYPMTITITGTTYHASWISDGIKIEVDCPRLEGEDAATHAARFRVDVAALREEFPEDE